MPPPHRIDPLEALRLLVERLRRLAPVKRPLKDAPRGYLAREIEVVVPRGRTPGLVARSNVFALPKAVRAGDVCRVLGVVTVQGSVPAPIPGESKDPGVWRVETGGAKPEGFGRTCPVEGVTGVGSGLVRIERVDEEGDWESLPRTMALTAGTLLDERTRAVLELARIAEVEVRVPTPLALAVLGDELSPARSSEGVEDSTGPWLSRSIKSLGYPLIDLGVRPETADSVRDAILHCRGRADVLVLVGGLGDGVTDRTVEHVERFEAQFTFHGVSSRGASRLFHARTLGMDLVGLGGKPLETAAVYDIYLRPALLARLGAPGAAWDWSLATWPCDGLLAGELGRAPGSWLIQPAYRKPRGDGGLEIQGLRAGNVIPHLPCAPEQTGWAILPPTGVSHAAGHGTRAHWQDVSPS